MATIDISHPHALGKDEAKKRANEVLARMKDSQGITGVWNGDTFDIQKPAKGTFQVSEKDVRIQIDLPFLLKPLRGKIESKINEELQRSLK